RRAFFRLRDAFDSRCTDLLTRNGDDTEASDRDWTVEPNPYGHARRHVDVRCGEDLSKHVLRHHERDHELLATVTRRGDHALDLVACVKRIDPELACDIGRDERHAELTRTIEIRKNVVERVPFLAEEVTHGFGQSADGMFEELVGVHGATSH